MLGNSRRKIELLNILLFSMPGTPVIYYGDEIGMGDNFYLGDRNGCRTPMQWSRDRNAGFSKANPQQLYLPITIDPEYHYEAINVENQQKNLSSLALVDAPRDRDAQKFQGVLARLASNFCIPENPKVLAFLRRHEDETILVVVNLSRFAQAAEIDLSRFAGCALDGGLQSELFSRRSRRSPYPITLGPHAHYWFVLRPQTAARARERKRVVPTIRIAPNIADAARGRAAHTVRARNFAGLHSRLPLVWRESADDSRRCASRRRCRFPAKRTARSCGSSK